ncbi:MAG TPA: cob(I)yrinic acid a,c-diamide adenosyltransferase [Polyangiaceae bacterium]
MARMKIYTKIGDTGETRLFGGTKIDKDDWRVEAYGSVDELNSVLGVARSHELSSEIDALCASLQSALFVVGAELASMPEQREKLRLKLIDADDIHALETMIDRFTEQLPPLMQFILPGGTRSAAALHHARTVCRRAERQVVALKKRSQVSGDLLIYLNRLGDLLFVLARLENNRAGVADVPWVTR